MPGMARTHPLDSCGTILSGLAKRLGLESRLVELRLQRQWPDLVGEPTGSHTWPDQIRFKKLYLVVRHSVWLQQLTFLKPALLAKIQSLTGPDVITDITFRVGEIPVHSAQADVSPSDRLLPIREEHVTEASAHTGSIQDPDLRRRFTTVISTYLSQPPLRPEEDRSPSL